MPDKERKLPSQQEPVLSLVKEHVGHLEAMEVLNENAFPALRLYGYNFFTKHPQPTEENLNEFQNTCLEISNREETYAQLHNPLCTVGLELESFYPPAIRGILSQLDIPLIKEEDPSNRLWEVMMPWTYSAETQIFMLEQLAKMRAVEPIPGLGSGQRRQKRRRMALHINYAMPEEVQDSDFNDPANKNHLYTVNDALILAFSSGKRLLEHPGPALTYDKQAERSLKTSEGKSRITFRVELRALEFTEPLTYALLYDSQRLVSTLFAKVRAQKVFLSDISPSEEQLTQMFDSFEKDFTAIRTTYNIPYNFVEGDRTTKEYAASLVDGTKVPSLVRSLIQATTRSIDRLLNPQ